MFLTLTHRADDTTSRAQKAQALAHAFGLLRRRIKREFGIEKLPFLAVFEAHLSGVPHLHVLLRCRYIPQRWLSDTMRKLLGSPIVDVRRIKNTRGMVSYVAKYLGKAPHKYENVKRYWRSLDYEVPEERYIKPPRDPHVEWERSPFRPSTLAWVAQEQGKRVEWQGEKLIIFDDEPPSLFARGAR